MIMAAAAEHTEGTRPVQGVCPCGNGTNTVWSSELISWICGPCVLGWHRARLAAGPGSIVELTEQGIRVIPRNRRPGAAP